MAKFKVGDKVVGNSKTKGVYVITKEGWRGVVTRVNSDDIITVKGPDGEGSLINFDVRGECFDLAKDTNKIVITTDGKTTTARMYDGNELVKTAKAKCSPDDTFDFMTGAKLAMERLEGEEKPVNPFKVGDYVKITGNQGDITHYLSDGSVGVVLKAYDYSCFVDGFCNQNRKKNWVCIEDLEKV